MLKLRNYLSVFALLSAMVSHAAAVTQDITLTAMVPAICTVADSTSPAAVTQQLTIDPTGRVSTSTVNFTFPIACNKPATLEVSSVNTGLSGPSQLSGYENRIHYTAATSGVFPVITLNTANAPSPGPGGSGPYTTTSSGPANGTLSVAVTPTANVNPLAAGAYTETLRLVITPVQ
jgi:hypothetical protein